MKKALTCGLIVSIIAASMVLLVGCGASNLPHPPTPENLNISNSVLSWTVAEIELTENDELRFRVSWQIGRVTHNRTITGTSFNLGNESSLRDRITTITVTPIIHREISSGAVSRSSSRTGTSALISFYG